MLSPICKALSMKYMECDTMLKVAIVGVGGISGAHIPAWQAMNNVELVAMCDVRPEQMDKYVGVNKYTDFEDMLAKETIDILDICLPTYLHADYSIMAMEKGIHVLCEKPISLHVEDVKRVYDTAAKNNVKFMVAQVLRFWPEYGKVKELVDSGKYGKILSGVMQRLGNRPNWSWDNWMTDEKRSGLVPYDLHIHDLDFMVYTFGRPKGQDVHRSKREDQDYLSVTYRYDDFFITAEAAWYAAPTPFSAGFRFQFEKAVVINDATGLHIYENDGKVLHLSGESKDAGVINLPQTDAYGEEIRYFADCVTNGTMPDRVKPEELETVIDIIDHM